MIDLYNFKRYIWNISQKSIATVNVIKIDLIILYLNIKFEFISLNIFTLFFKRIFMMLKIINFFLSEPN